MSCFIQDFSEREVFLDECEHPEGNMGILDENSNDENDVDVETMSGKLNRLVFTVAMLRTLLNFVT